MLSIMLKLTMTLLSRHNGIQLLLRNLQQKGVRITLLDISRVREYLYKRAVHLVVVVVVQQPKIEFADLRNI